jgi:hypothetical protein
MIFKYPHGFPYELYFLTGDLLGTLAQQAVPFNSLSKISSYHDKLTFNEVATFIAVQRAAARVFGVDLPEASSEFGEGYNGGMVAEAFNGIDSEAIFGHLKAATSFHSTVIGQVMLVAVNVDGDPRVGSWHKLDAKNISWAVQETIYERVGYLDSHFGSVAKPALGELTMTEVYKTVHLQNA